MYTLSRIFTGIHNPCTEQSKVITTKGHRIRINYSQKGELCNQIVAGEAYLTTMIFCAT
jgi:hypothetical protein